MISDVINQEMYTRIFILMMTVFMFGVQSSNLRAFYKKLYGVASDFQNDVALGFGLLSTVTLPLIGIFDEQRYTNIHGFCAGVYFLSFMIYGVILGQLLYSNRDKYPAEEQASIQKVYFSSYGLVISIFGFGILFALFGHGGWTAILEWVVVLYQLNFFSLISFDNPYYDTVHQPTAALKQ